MTTDKNGIEFSHEDGDTYRLVDTETGEVLASGLSAETKERLETIARQCVEDGEGWPVPREPRYEWGFSSDPISSDGPEENK